MADPEARRAALEALEQHANVIALHGSSEGRRIADAQRAGAEAAELATADVDAWKSFQLAIGSGLVEAFHHLRLLDRGEAQEWRRRFREALEMPTGSPLTARPEGLRCSFCGRLEGEVGALVAGPAVYVCEGCVDLFNEIIRGRRAPRVG